MRKKRVTKEEEEGENICEKGSQQGKELLNKNMLL